MSRPRILILIDALFSSRLSRYRRGSKLRRLTASNVPEPSPPSRGRGSKRDRACMGHRRTQSPPSRGRGSKRNEIDRLNPLNRSPPSRGRESKLWFPVWPSCFGKVAPFPGAWIETWRFQRSPPQPRVAPFPGAWIETRDPCQSKRKPTRRPLPGGVDRNIQAACGRAAASVAPFPGAWIETDHEPPRVE